MLTCSILFFIVTGLSLYCGSHPRTNFSCNRAQFCKIVFQRQLAVTFSWSGLGKSRKRNKTSFKDHAIYSVFMSKCRVHDCEFHFCTYFTSAAQHRMILACKRREALSIPVQLALRDTGCRLLREVAWQRYPV